MMIPKKAFIARIVDGQIKNKALVPSDIDFALGRSSKSCSYVIAKDTNISRVHCILRFDSASGLFLLTDKSTNGVYLEDNSRIVKGVPYTLYPDTVFYISNPDYKMTVLTAEA